MQTFAQWLETEFKPGDPVEFNYQGDRRYRGFVGSLGVPNPEGLSWINMPDGSGFYHDNNKLQPRIRPVEDFREIDLHILEKLQPSGVEPHGSRQLGTSGDDSDLDVKVQNIGLAVNILEKLGYNIEKKKWGARAIKGEHQIDLFQKNRP